MSKKLLKPINDQFILGLLGGLIAGVLKDIPDLFIVEIFKIKHLAFWDYVGEMIFNRIPVNFIDHFIAFLIQIAFSFALGILYSVFIVQKFPTKHHLIRGAIYGSSCWFVLISGVKLYHITPLMTKDLFTPLATLLFSAGYGLILAYVDKYFSPKKGQNKPC